ncbi:MAG: FHA domain-containing protein [Cystobacter sp.]
MRNAAWFARGPTVLGVAVDEHLQVVGSVDIEPGQSVTVGRHTACGLHLPSESVSLRQLVVYAQSGAPGAPPDIRLWDLNTQQPFFTEDGEPNGAVIARGLLYVAVDGYALLFMPTRGFSGRAWPEDAEAAWSQLPPRQFIDQRSCSTDLGPPPRPRGAGQPPPSRIIRVDAPKPLSGQDRPESAWGSLRLVGAGQREEHYISLSRLEQGVLLGRYDRCGIVLASSGLGLSRVHLLLIRMGDEVLAIDTASSNGTWRGPVEVQTTALEDSDSLELGESLLIHWRRLSRHSRSVG